MSDLAALVDHLSIAQVDIFGLSMGGNIALNYALTHPERVSSLIVSGTGAGSDDPSAFAATTHAWAEAAETGGMAAFVEIISANPIFAEYANRGPMEAASLRELMHSPSLEDVFSQLAVKDDVEAVAEELLEAVRL